MKRVVLAGIMSGLAITVSGLGLQATAAHAADEPTSSVRETWSVRSGIGGGTCTATSDVYAYPGSGYVQVNTTARVNAKLAGCTARTWITIEGTEGTYSTELDVPTACSTTDFSCPKRPQPGEPGRGHSYKYDYLPVQGDLVSVTGHSVGPR